MMNSSKPDIDYLELQLAAELMQLLDGLSIGAHIEVPRAADLCSTFERFLPRELVVQYPEWRGEALDGFFMASATKTGRGTAEFLGLCILMSDQRVTPFFVELELAGPDNGAHESTLEAGPERRAHERTFEAGPEHPTDGVHVRQLKLGEPGTGPLGISGPAVHSGAARKLLDRLPARLDSIAWTYVLETPAQP